MRAIRAILVVLILALSIVAEYGAFSIFMNSRYSPAVVADLLSSIFDGTFQVEKIDWGAGWGRVELYGVRILDRNGRLIISSERARVRLASFLPSIVLGRLSLDDVEVDNGYVLLSFDQDNNLSLVNIFSPETETDQGPDGIDGAAGEVTAADESSFRVTLSNIKATNCQVVLDFTDLRLELFGVNAGGLVEVKSSTDLNIDAWAKVAHGSLDLLAEGLPESLKSLPFQNIDVGGFRWKGYAFETGSVTGMVDGAALDVTGGMNLVSVPEGFHGKVLLGVPPDAGLVARIPGVTSLGDLKLEGSFTGHIEGPEGVVQITADGLDMAELHPSLPILQQVELVLKLENEGRLVSLTKGQVNLGQGQISLSADLDWKKGQAAARVDMTGVTLRNLLDPASTSNLQTMASGSRGGGEWMVDGLLDAGLELSVHGLTDIEQSLVVEAELQGMLKSPPRSRNQILPIDAVKLQSNLLYTHSDQVLTVGNLEASAGKMLNFSTGGNLNFQKSSIDMDLTLTSSRVSGLLASLVGGDGAGPDLKAGRGSLKGRVWGNLENPSADLRLTLADAGLGDTLLHTVSTRISLIDGTVHIPDLEGKAEWGGLSASGSMVLWDGSLTSITSDPAFIVEVRGRGIPVGPLFPAEFGLNLSADVAATVEGTVSNPSGTAHVATSRAGMMGYSLDSIIADVELKNQDLLIERLVIGLGDYRTVRVNGKLGMDGRFKGAVAAQRIPLEMVEAALALNMPMGGDISLDVALWGDFSSIPYLEGRVEVRDLEVDEVVLGSAVLLFEGDGEKLEITGTDVFSHFAVKGQMVMDGSPIQLAVAAPNLPLSAVPAGLLPEGVDGDVGFALDLLLPVTGSDKPTVTVTMEKIDLRLLDEMVRNSPGTGPLFRKSDAAISRISYQEPQIKIEGFKVWNRGRQVAVDGTVDTSGGMDLAVVGELNLALLRVADDVIARSSGDLSLQIQLQGNVDHPVAIGEIQFRDAVVVPRSIQKEIALREGVVLLQPGSIAIDRSRPLVGGLDEGIFRIYGQMGVDGLTPVSARGSLWGHQLSYAIPGELRVTVDTDLDMVAENLIDPERRHVVVSGQVDILDARYTKNYPLDVVQLGTSLIENLNRRASTGGGGGGGGGGRTISQQDQLLSQINLRNVSIHAKDNVFVESKILNMRLDLELRMDLQLDGPVDQLRPMGQVEIIAGEYCRHCSLHFSNREFIMEHGTVTFDGTFLPVVDIAAEREFQCMGLSATRNTLSASMINTTGPLSANRGDDFYLMQIELSGPLDNLQYSLMSTPESDQRNLYSMLTTGSCLEDLTAESQSQPALELFLGPYIEKIEDKVLERLPLVDTLHLIPEMDRGVTVWVESKYYKGRLGVHGSGTFTGEQNTHRAGAELRLLDNLSFQVAEEKGKEDLEATVGSSIKLTVPLD